MQKGHIQQECKRGRIEEEEAMEDRHSNSSTEALPQDLVIDILSRVPARCLLRLRCVSKSWNSITHDRYFTNLHCRHASVDNRHLCLVIPRGDEEADAWAPKTMKLSLYTLFEEDEDDAWTMQADHSRPPLAKELDVLDEFFFTPCRGLLSICNKYRIDVFNPMTQEYNSFSYGATVPLLDTPSFTGFGFDPSTNKYKAVTLILSDNIEDDNTSKWTCEICTLGSGMWRSIATSSIRNTNLCGSGFEVKGILYWADYKWNPRFCVSFIETIVSLDLKDEKFRFVPVPKIPCLEEGHADKKKALFITIGKLDEEHLFLIYVDGSIEEARTEIWMLEDATKHVWVKLYDIRHEQLLPGLYWLPKYIWNGNILFSNYEDLFCYNPSKETLRKVTGNQEEYPFPSSCMVLTETLCSLATP